MQRSASIVVCGLPESGKTTYLAALWHILSASPDFVTALKLSSRDYDDYEYIREIHARWIKGEVQPHTQALTQKIVGLDLINAEGEEIQLRVPDHSGETYEALWAQRHCELHIASALENRSGILLFINVDTIEKPQSLISRIEAAAEMEANKPAGDNKAVTQAKRPAKPFKASEVPDQVKLIDILQTLSTGSFRADHERIAIIMSAWDLLASDGETPEVILKRELPLLHDYLETGVHGWETNVYGVSAQGGEYHDPEKSSEPSDATKKLLAEKPAERISIVGDEIDGRDLTLPIDWLSP